MRILYKLKWLFLSVLFLFFLLNCNPLKIFGGAFDEISSLIPIDGLSTSHIPNETFFYINIKDSYYVGEGFQPLQTLVSAMDFGPGTDCKIQKTEDPEEPTDPGEGSTEDLYCLMDIMEGDLWFHEIILEYNVPPGMCDYLGIDVPWHFNQKVGRGPGRVYECTDFIVNCNSDDGEPEAEVETRYCLGGCTPATGAALCGQETGTVGCGGAGGRAYTEATDFCKGLDQSENDLANCCMGDYDLVSHPGGEVTESSWGGELRNCIGGLGRISWEEFTDGRPVKLILDVRNDGINADYEIPALIEVFDGHRRGETGMRIPTFITANYWEDVEEKDSETSKPRFYNAPTQSELPEAYLRPLPYEGHPYLTLSCMNKAYERKHRIHLLIREWNTQEEFHSFITSEGSRGDPDIVGEEGSFCEYYEGDEENILPQDTECNDSYDADDWNNEDPGTGRRYNAYPEIIYR